MNKSILGFAVTVLLTVSAHAGFAAEPTHVPATPLAAANADLIARADRALRDYVTACSTGSKEAIARLVTSDAVIEYELEERGTYLKVEAAQLLANRSVNGEPTGTGAHISTLWIFPTPHSNVVLTQFRIASDVRAPAQVPDAEHMAIIEMRGDRIVKMRNFRNLHDAPQATGQRGEPFLIGCTTAETTMK